MTAPRAPEGAAAHTAPHAGGPSIIANDFRHRKTDFPIRAMLHAIEGPCHRKWGRARDWILRYESIAAAEADIGELVFTCQACLRGKGAQLDRL